MKKFVGDDCGIETLSDGRTRWFTGWGLSYCAPNEESAWSALADALDARGFRALASKARERTPKGAGGEASGGLKSRSRSTWVTEITQYVLLEPLNYEPALPDDD